MGLDAFGYDDFTRHDTTTRPRDGIYTTLVSLEERLAIAAMPPIDKTGYVACEWCGWLEPAHRMCCPGCGRFCSCEGCE